MKKITAEIFDQCKKYLFIRQNGLRYLNYVI